MSYDLAFWRPTRMLNESARTIYLRLLNGDPLEGIAELSGAEIQAAFLAEFDNLDIDDFEIAGPMFSILLSERSRRLVSVNCNWAILQHAELVDRVIRTGKERLKCNCYNPQTNEYDSAQ